MKHSASRSSILFVLLSLCAGICCADDGASVINLYFAGDTALSTATVHRLLEKHGGQLFAENTLPENADVIALNLESPLTEQNTPVSKKFNFRMNSDFLTVLKASKVTLVNLANNHILDYGGEGLLDTINNLDQAGIYHTGAGATLSQARAPVELTIKGRKFGFLGYYGDGWGCAGKDRPGVAPHFRQVMFRDIARLKENVDYVIVNIHWGKEKELQPAQWQCDLAHELVDAGADIVIGHHPHILQGMETYNGGIIAYSLGNFVFSHGPLYRSILLHIAIENDQLRAECLPIECGWTRVRPLTGERRDKVLQLIDERSKLLMPQTPPDSTNQ